MLTLCDALITQRNHLPNSTGEQRFNKANTLYKGVPNPLQYVSVNPYFNFSFKNQMQIIIFKDIYIF